MSIRAGSALGCLLALACLLGFGAQARAAYDPIASGTTKISLDPGFLALLSQNGVKLKATGGAKLSAKTLSFPVSGGKFDPVAGTGTVEQQGSLVFQGAKGSIPLRSLQLKTTQRHAPFSGKLGGSQLKLFSAKAMKVARQGFGDTVTTTKLTLSAKVAGRLAKKLHLPGVFAAGEAFGFSSTAAQPATVTIRAVNRTTLTLSPEFLAKLNSLFVAINPIFPAEHQGPTFTLPIAAGKLAPDASAGTLALAGAIEFLQLGGGQVFWREPGLDLGAKNMGAEVEVDPSPPYAGKLGAIAIAGLALAAPPMTDAKARTIAVSAAALVLNASTAQALNELFARPQGKDGVFAAGEALGTVSFVAQGQ